MLLMFILSLTAGWSAVVMVFYDSIWNLLLGLISIFFFFRGLELIDKINNFGTNNDNNTPPPTTKEENTTT